METEKDCKHPDSYVTNSRTNEFGIRRRRECSKCGHRWSTMEIEVPDTRGDPWLAYRKLVIADWLALQLRRWGTK